MRRTPLRRPHLTILCLVAQAKFRDQCAVTVRAFAAQISQQATALADHHHQSAARVQVVLMYFEMFGHLIDTPGEQRDLHLGRTSIGFMNASLSDDARFFFNL
jgi:hypothetical protein